MAGAGRGLQEVDQPGLQPLPDKVLVEGVAEGIAPSARGPWRTALCPRRAPSRPRWTASRRAVSGGRAARGLPRPWRP
eukprot:1564452-Alexandrium_andersonii.AAC.1